MSTISSPRPAVKAKQRTLLFNDRLGILWISDARKSTAYYTDAIHGAEGGTAYSLYKIVPPADADEQREYAVLLAADGNHSCECKGHIHYGHKKHCRHVAALLTLRAAGRLPS